MRGLAATAAIAIPSLFRQWGSAMQAQRSGSSGPFQSKGIGDLPIGGACWFTLPPVAIDRLAFPKFQATTRPTCGPKTVDGFYRST